MKTLYTAKGLKQVLEKLRSDDIFTYSDERLINKFICVLEVNDLATFPERTDSGKFVKIGDSKGCYKILMEEKE
jgi:hypothetical protein